MNVVPATASDYEAFAVLFPELGVPDRTPSRAYFEMNIVPGGLFAKEGDTVAGYVWTRVRGEKLHVVHVIVSPTHRRRGVARAMLGAVAERARSEGREHWMLNVKPDNVKAIALYESVGFVRMFESVSMRLPWACLPELEAAAGGSVARALTPEDDARFEAALGLSPGEIAGYRSLGRTPYGTEDAAGPTAAGLLDPTFPGASPFRVRRPEHARAVLEAMRPHVSADGIFVFVENEPAVEAMMTRVGATPVLRALRMEGLVPRE